MVDGINGINGQIGQLGASAASARPAAGYDGPRYTDPQDRVTLSAQGKKKGNENAAGVKDENNLSAEEKQQVEELRKRDAEVKAHEQAHMAAGGGIVQGGAAYQYQHGPDGKMYAVGGEVKIDASAERTPEATIRKMQQVQQAALAPAQPSGTDRAVAARAAQVEAQARLEKAEETEETSQNEETSQSQDTQPAAESTEASGSSADAIDAEQKPATPNADPSRFPPPSELFSYKADLSPNKNNGSIPPKGLKIDLVA